MKTENKLLENTRRYRLTKGGVIRNMFCHIKERSIKYNCELEFDSDQIFDWIMGSAKFHKIYKKWCDSGFKKALKPSIDRKDPLKGYLFSNIQVVTYQYNRDKGDREKLILWGKPIIQCDINGNHIQKFTSIKLAADKLNLHRGLISNVLIGERNHTGGYKFIYQNP